MWSNKKCVVTIFKRRITFAANDGHISPNTVAAARVSHVAITNISHLMNLNSPLKKRRN